jgi:hypothetical protein
MVLGELPRSALAEKSNFHPKPKLLIFESA